MSVNLPSLIPGSLAASASGAIVYDMRGIDRASVQIAATLTAAATCVVTLTLSNDGVSYFAFSTAKTVTLTGAATEKALFELGPIDYAYLQISFAAPSAGTVAASSILYAVATITQTAN